MSETKFQRRKQAVVMACIAAAVYATPSAAVDLQGIVTSVDAATIIGQQTVRDADLVSMKPDGGCLTVLQAIADLLPDGVDVDALSILDDDTLVFSTSVTFDLGGVEVHDEDLVAYDGSVMTLFFDGSAAGLPAAADIDAVHVASQTPLKLYYSLDAPATVAGLVIADDDIVELFRGVHTVVHAGTDIFAGQEARADIDALWVDPDAFEYVISVDVSIARATGRTAAEDEDLVRWVGGQLRPLFVGASAGLDAPGLDIDAVHIRTNLFADGFESGDTTRWSSTTP